MSPIAPFPSHVLEPFLLQATPVFDQPVGHAHSLIFAPFFLFFGLVGSIIALIPFWFIFKKAGFSPWLAILMILPLINWVVLYVVAFSEWRVAPAISYPVPPTAGGIYPPPA
jgi:hypothetical protein